MLLSTTPYTKCVSKNPLLAQSLQSDVAYAFSHFDVFDATMHRTLARIRTTLFSSIGISDQTALASFCKITTIAGALALPKHTKAPTTVNDTRFAIVIGKPTCTKSGNPALEVIYVVGVRIVNRMEVFLTSLFARPRKTFVEARPGAADHVISEGKRITAATSCCTKLSNECRLLVDASTERFFKFIEDFSTALGDVNAPLLAVEQEPPPVIVRTNSNAVVEQARAIKRKLDVI